MDAPTLPVLLTPTDVGLWLSLPVIQVLRMAKRGEIPSVTLPTGDLVFDRAVLARWLDARRAGREEAPHAAS